jgi:hypothetical protein
MNWIFWRFVLLFLAAVAMARGQTVVTQVVIANPTNYILGADAVDLDPGTNRHIIVPQAEIDFAAAGSYRVEFDLLDPQDVVMASGSSLTGNIPAGTRIVPAQVIPSAANPLIPRTYYRMRARVFDLNGGPNAIAGRTENPGGFYLHLTGTSPATSARNALSVVTGVTVDREWLLETDGANSSIPVTVSWAIHRYDNWNGTNDPQAVAMDFTLALEDGNGTPISSVTLVPVGQNIEPVVNSFSGGGATKEPASATGTATFKVDPAVLLGLKTVRVKATALHLDDAPSTFKTGNTLASAATQILHLSGALSFGGIATTFTRLDGDVLTYAGAPADVWPTSVHRRMKPEGTLDGRADHSFTSPTFLKVEIASDGAASVVEGDVTLTPDDAAATEDVTHGIAFQRTGDLKLNEIGARSTVLATLPTGVGWAADRFGGLLESEIDFGEIALDQALLPQNANVTINPGAGQFFLCEETKPVFIETASLTWKTNLGEFRAASVAVAHSERKPLLDFIAQFSATLVSPTMATKKSNDHVYNHVTAIADAQVEKGASSGGELSGALAVNPGQFSTHLPYNASVSWSTIGQITIANDLIDTSASTLSNVASVLMPYQRHGASTAACGTAFDNISLPLANDACRFTADGGLRGTGTPVMDLLRWGYIAANEPTPSPHDDHVQSVTEAFPVAGFLTAGTFLRGDLNTETRDHAPGVLLLSGFDAATGAVAERPKTEAYKQGDADYPGMNFKCAGGGFRGRSTVQGTKMGPYGLKNRSKYYARWSGVSGIHESKEDDFTEDGPVGGYLIDFTRYGFAYLSNEIFTSHTEGSVALPLPVYLNLGFKRLEMNALGQLTTFEMTNNGGVDGKTMAGWGAPVTIHSSRFQSVSECEPGAGTTLVLGFSAHAAHFAQKLDCELGVKPDGHFARPSDPDTLVSPLVPRRVTLPPVMTFAGLRDGEDYTFTPAQGACLNDDPVAINDGFWSMFGTLDLPFFRDAQVHIHARAVNPPDTAHLYLMGGWPVKGWQQEGLDPFTKDVFDPNNDGWPVAVGLDQYRKVVDNGNDNYLVRAKQEWLNLVNFDYPLRWSGLRRNFNGHPVQAVDLKSITVDHRAMYVDANNAALDFGVNYDGLPDINLSKIVFDELDEQTGVAHAITQAGMDRVFKTLQNGIDDLAVMLDDKAERLVKRSLDAVLEEPLDLFIAAVREQVEDGAWTEVDLQGPVDNAFRTVNAPMTQGLKKMGEAFATTQSLVADIDARLVRVDRAIDAIIDKVDIDPSTGEFLEQADQGLTKWISTGETGFKRTQMTVLAWTLIGTADIALSLKTKDGRTVQEVLDDSFLKIDATIEEVIVGLQQVKAAIAQVRADLQNGVQMGAEIVQIFEDSHTELEQIMAEIGDETELMMQGFAAEQMDHLEETLDEWRDRIRLRIEEKLNASALIAKVQGAIKQRLYDLQTAMNQAVDSLFQNVNEAMKAALADVLGGVQAEYDKLAGELGKKIGESSLSGYAQINGDSLDRLRLDGNLLFKPNEDKELKIQGFFEVSELDSDGPAGSVAPRTRPLRCAWAHWMRRWISSNRICGPIWT